MKELANSLAELVAIIMIMITLAVSSAALSSWMGGEASAAQTQSTTTTRAQPAMISGIRQ